MPYLRAAVAVAALSAPRQHPVEQLAVVVEALAVDIELQISEAARPSRLALVAQRAVLVWLAALAERLRSRLSRRQMRSPPALAAVAISGALAATQAAAVVAVLLLQRAVQAPQRLVEP